MTNRGDATAKRRPVIRSVADLVMRALSREGDMLNPSLLLHRLIEWEVDKDGRWNLTQKDQHRILKGVAQAIMSSAVKESLHACWERQQETLASLQRSEYSVCAFRGTVQWRLAIGMATGGVLEAGGMTLHRLYGFPYLPGTALKGLGLAWARELLDGGKIKDESLADVFGTTQAQGRVVFFDAIPEGNLAVGVDIMNPHYKNYYEGEKPPADYLSPEMIYFLTVLEGTQFRFWLAAKPGTATSLELAVRFLKEGLANLGIGAKTHAGYGRVE